MKNFTFIYVFNNSINVKVEAEKPSEAIELLKKVTKKAKHFVCKEDRSLIIN